MKRVAIVAVTRMTEPNICVGALGVDDGRSLRLLGPNGESPMRGEYEVGQVWDLELIARPACTPPHVEDVLVQRKVQRLPDVPDLGAFLEERVDPWRDDPDGLFDGFVRWTGRGSGFVAEPGIPRMSTGFWVPNTDLPLEEQHFGYRRRGRADRRLKYVGVADAPAVIPAGTLVRVSLARWWAPPEFDEERCYLQLSGSY